MILRFIRIFCIFLFCFTNNISAQQERLKTFSQDSKDFFKDLKNFMSVTANSEHKDIVVEFEKKYNQGLISQNNFGEIKNIFDLMLKKKKKPSTHFKYFIESLNNFVDLASFQNELINWLEIIDYLIHKF